VTHFFVAGGAVGRPCYALMHRAVKRRKKLSLAIQACSLNWILVSNQTSYHYSVAKRIQGLVGHASNSLVSNGKTKGAEICRSLLSLDCVVSLNQKFRNLPNDY